MQKQYREENAAFAPSLFAALTHGRLRAAGQFLNCSQFLSIIYTSETMLFRSWPERGKDPEAARATVEKQQITRTFLLLRLFFRCRFSGGIFCAVKNRCARKMS